MADSQVLSGCRRPVLSFAGLLILSRRLINGPLIFCFAILRCFPLGRARHWTTGQSTQITCQLSGRFFFFVDMVNRGLFARMISINTRRSPITGLTTWATSSAQSADRQKWKKIYFSSCVERVSFGSSFCSASPELMTWMTAVIEWTESWVGGSNNLQKDPKNAGSVSAIFSGP